MAELSKKQRSQLLSRLLSEMGQNQRDRPTLTGGEAAAKIGTAFLQKKRADRLAKEEAGAEKTNTKMIENALSQALGGGQESVFGPIHDKPGETTPESFMNGTSGTPNSPRASTPQSQQASLAQALAGNPDNRALQAVFQQQMTPPEKEKDPAWNLKQIQSGDQNETWITRNGLPIERFTTSDKMQKVMQGTPEDYQGTEAQVGKHKQEFGKRVAAVNAWAETGTDFLSMMRENPGANTVTASIANFGNRMLGEVKALSTQGIYEVEDDFRGFEVKDWGDVFDANGLAGANARVKNGFLALAIQRAAAMGLGTGRALSDRDVEMQLQTLGANQNDPDIIASLFSDSFSSMNDSISAEKDQFSYLSGFEVGNFDFGGTSDSKVEDYLEQRRQKLGR